MVLTQQKKSGKNVEQVGTFDVLIGGFRPIYAFLKFKKSGIFSIFGQIWQFFFLKIGFWAKLVLLGWEGKVDHTWVFFHEKNYRKNMSQKVTKLFSKKKYDFSFFFFPKKKLSKKNVVKKKCVFLFFFPKKNYRKKMSQKVTKLSSKKNTIFLFFFPKKNNYRKKMSKKKMRFSFFFFQKQIIEKKCHKKWPDSSVKVIRFFFFFSKKKTIIEKKCRTKKNAFFFFFFFSKNKLSKKNVTKSDQIVH